MIFYLLPIVNSPLLIWIDYYYQFELHLTNLTNLLNELTLPLRENSNAYDFTVAMGSFYDVKSHEGLTDLLFVSLLCRKTSVSIPTSNGKLTADNHIFTFMSLIN